MWQWAIKSLILCFRLEISVEVSKALNILFKFVSRLRNVSKIEKFDYIVLTKWKSILISFERMLRNIQKILLLNS